MYNPRQLMWPRVLSLSLILALGYGIRSLRLSAFATHRDAQRYEDVYYLPPPAWLPVLSLGYRSALADLIWCKSLVYFGEELGQRGQLRFVFEYADAVIALSPDFKQAYRWTATASVYRPEAGSIADGLHGARYLERALVRWPNDGELHWEYASLLRFQLAPLLPNGAEKDRLLTKAAPHLTIAASMGAGPAWLALNSSSLLERLGQTDQAIRHLEEVYGTVKDEATKKEIEERLARMRSQTFVEAARAANDAFEKSRVESYPYMSPDLFMLVGPKPGTNVANVVWRRGEATEDEVDEER